MSVQALNAFQDERILVPVYTLQNYNSRGTLRYWFTRNSLCQRNTFDQVSFHTEYLSSYQVS